MFRDLRSLPPRLRRAAAGFHRRCVPSITPASTSRSTAPNSTTGKFAANSLLASATLDAPHVRADRREFAFHPVVAAIEVINTINQRFAFRAHGRDHQTRRYPQV